MSGDQDTHLSAGDAKFVGTWSFFLSLHSAGFIASISIFNFETLRADVIHTDGGFLGIPWVSCHGI
jgi:hypothetical protein